MRLKFFISCLVAALALLCSVNARAQEQQPEDEVVRGAFITTRPAARQESKKETASVPDTATPATPKRAPKTASSATNKHKSANAKNTKTAQPQVAHANDAGGTQFSKANFKPAGIGIGYTLFMRDELGAGVRVDPKREFASGEAIRLLIESNTDGYLYIFDAENDATPSLIFPNAKLKGGDNHISAHVPYEIPSSAETDETLRWFVFNDTPATERVYILVSRRPLEDVPSSGRLVEFCAGKDQTCAWKPTGDQWMRLKGINSRDVIAVSRARDAGLSQTAAEREAATRGLGLAASAPQPTVIYMISSADANVLITTVDLIHKK
ncbi:MAG: hypothetical protein QOE33_1418 [Acidobacteriota bacterium]|nr:hypothetical protein [Acidobacteriota bacterium]